jgi:hypothetical protein
MKMVKSPLLFLLVLALFIPSCRRGTDETGSDKVRTETVDGVTLVHNPPAPLHPDKAVRFEEEISFGGEETGPGTVFNPGPYAIDGTNHIYIVDAADSTIKVFGEDGGFLREIGRKGQGPGEFGQIYFLGFAPEGRLLVMDSQNRRTSFFGPGGDFLGSYQWMTLISIPHLILDATYIVQESVRGEGGSRMFLKTYDFAGNEIGTWIELETSETKLITRTMAGGGIATFGTSVPHSRRSVLTGDQELKRVYHCLNDAYLIEVYDSGGRLFRKIDRPYERVPFTEADKEEIIASVPGDNKEFKELYEDMPWPRVKAVTGAMFCDDRGYLWVATYETREEGSRKLTAYDVFDPDGIYDARVWLAARPGKFALGKMYQFEDDEETGIRVLTRYRVVWE